MEFHHFALEIVEVEAARDDVAHLSVEDKGHAKFVLAAERSGMQGVERHLARLEVVNGFYFLTVHIDAGLHRAADDGSLKVAVGVVPAEADFLLLAIGIGRHVGRGERLLSRRRDDAHRLHREHAVVGGRNQMKAEAGVACLAGLIVQAVGNDARELANVQGVDSCDVVHVKFVVFADGHGQRIGVEATALGYGEFNHIVRACFRLEGGRHGPIVGRILRMAAIVNETPQAVVSTPSDTVGIHIDGLPLLRFGRGHKVVLEHNFLRLGSQQGACQGWK